MDGLKYSQILVWGDRGGSWNKSFRNKKGPAVVVVFSLMNIICKGKRSWSQIDLNNKSINAALNISPGSFVVVFGLCCKL